MKRKKYCFGLEVSDLPGIGILNGSRALATEGALGSLTGTIQSQRQRILVFAETAKLKTTEVKEVSEQGRALHSRLFFSK
ncbi:MAG: hypothetical protein ACP5E9_10875 [Candidatus Methanospirareceae archaeon]